MGKKTLWTVAFSIPRKSVTVRVANKRTISAAQHRRRSKTLLLRHGHAFHYSWRWTGMKCRGEVSVGGRTGGRAGGSQHIRKRAGSVPEKDDDDDA